MNLWIRRPQQQHTTPINCRYRPVTAVVASFAGWQHWIDRHDVVRLIAYVLGQPPQQLLRCSADGWCCSLTMRDHRSFHCLQQVAATELQADNTRTSIYRSPSACSVRLRAQWRCADTDNVRRRPADSCR